MLRTTARGELNDFDARCPKSVRQNNRTVQQVPTDEPGSNSLCKQTQVMLNISSNQHINNHACAIINSPLHITTVELIQSVSQQGE